MGMGITSDYEVVRNLKGDFIEVSCLVLFLDNLVMGISIVKVLGGRCSNDASLIIDVFDFNGDFVSFSSVCSFLGLRVAENVFLDDSDASGAGGIMELGVICSVSYWYFRNLVGGITICTVKERRMLSFEVCYLDISVCGLFISVNN